MIALTLLIAVLLVVGMTARRKWDKVEPEISFFYPGGHYIMLTYNDGLDSSLTPKLLDMLKGKRARVTLFVQGVEVGMNKKLLQRIKAERHEIGNYGWDLTAEGAGSYKEPDFSQRVEDEIVEQISKTSMAVEATLGERTHVFRPPSKYVRAFTYASKHAPLVLSPGDGKPAHQVILHSLDADNSGKVKNAQQIKDVLLSKAKKGDVIMCTLSEASIEATAALIDKLMAEGYEFLTISEMMSFPDDKPH